MSAVALTAGQVAGLVREVCELEVRAFKPGNVSFASPGHGMTAELFVASAAAMAAPLCRAGATVGERVFDAVAATRAVAGCNTNLGIVLLLAPLVEAALAGAAGRRLRDRVGPVLAALTVDDARQAYAAIRVAAPGGLGSSRQHDVRNDPDVTLLEAMRAAAAVDRIAAEYADGYAGIFDFGVPMAGAAMREYGCEATATVAVYLGWMAHQPDTHVARKFGNALAAAVRDEALAFRDAHANVFAPRGDPEAAMPLLQAFDTSLKRRGINPGTSADLTVASLVALRLQTALDLVANDRSAAAADGFHPPRALARVFHQPV